VNGKPRKLKNSVMRYKQFVTKSVKMIILYLPEMLMQELVLSPLISTLDQRQNKPSIIMEET